MDKMKISKFTDIGQLRNVIGDINHYFSEVTQRPIIEFTGTVKLHGCNGGVRLPLCLAQSRERFLTIEEDNYGFALFVSHINTTFKLIYDKIVDDFQLPENVEIMVYGEWAGNGIQSGVGISQFPKAFYIFGVKVLNDVSDETDVSRDHDGYWLVNWNIDEFHGVDGIYDIRKFGQYKMTIDFNQPELTQNDLIALTLEVERKCPVTVSRLGENNLEGKVLLGEGIVWEHINIVGRKTTFKVKGKEHSPSKIKTLAPIDVEKVNGINEFIEYAVTENRLAQGYEILFTRNNINPSMTDIGSFIKWVHNDVIKEESDTLDKNNLTVRDISSSLSKKAKVWFLSRINHV